MCAGLSEHELPQLVCIVSTAPKVFSNNIPVREGISLRNWLANVWPLKPQTARLSSILMSNISLVSLGHRDLHLPAFPHPVYTRGSESVYKKGGRNRFLSWSPVSEFASVRASIHGEAMRVIHEINFSPDVPRGDCLMLHDLIRFTLSKHTLY